LAEIIYDGGIAMAMFNFVADICGTVYGEIEADTEELARGKIQENLRLPAVLDCDKDAELNSEWDFKSKCHGNCCAFSGNTDDEYGLDISLQEDSNA
jgi:hypothetical protein